MTFINKIDSDNRYLSLLLSAGHNKSSIYTKSIYTATRRHTVTECVTKALAAKAAGSITPHSFRHYFVTTVLLGTGNLKLAQELARHSSIAVTQRYAHLSDDELDKGYREVIEE